MYAPASCMESSLISSTTNESSYFWVSQMFFDMMLLCFKRVSSSRWFATRLQCFPDSDLQDRVELALVENPPCCLRKAVFVLVFPIEPSPTSNVNFQVEAMVVVSVFVFAKILFCPSDLPYVYFTCRTICKNDCFCTLYLRLTILQKQNSNSTQWISFSVFHQIYLWWMFFHFCC